MQLDLRGKPVVMTANILPGVHGVTVIPGPETERIAGWNQNTHSDQEGPGSVPAGAVEPVRQLVINFWGPLGTSTDRLVSKAVWALVR